jgi:predicted ATPase
MTFLSFLQALIPPRIVIQEKIVEKVVTVEKPVYVDRIVPVPMAYEHRILGEKLEECAERLRHDSGSDSDFLKNVELYIFKQFTYEKRDDIHTLDDAWWSHTGDCSEYAMVASAMLTHMKIPVKFVSGVVQAKEGQYRHTRCRATVDVDPGNPTGCNFLYLNDGLT